MPDPTPPAERLRPNGTGTPQARGQHGAAPDRYPHNLPAQLSSFVGRGEEIAAIQQLLAASRLLTLTGAPGIGKTRLALQVASEMASRWPDGTWLVELAGLADPNLVTQSIASALGVREQPNQALVDTLTDGLRARELLVVLDNCEHLAGACADLASAVLRLCPDVRIMATSRVPLRVEGETTWRVPSLSVPDVRQASDELALADQVMRYESARLFVERARAVRPSFALTARDAVAVTTICQRLDGIPLAIELAASRVRGLTPGQIARHIQDCFRVLTGGNRTALPRQQTLRAAFDWSHDLLTEPERALLRDLSVFAGGFTLEAGEIVCGRAATGDPAFVTSGPSSDQVLDVLLQLIDGSLVQVENEESGDSRYRLLGPIRQYALEQLREAGEEATLRRRHLAWCLDLAERGAEGRFGPNAAVWAEQLAVEHDNMRAALAWGLADPDPWSVDMGLRLAGVLHHVWYHRDQLSEGRQWLERFLAASQERSHQADVEPEARGGVRAAGWDAADAVRLGTLGTDARVVALNGLGHLAYNQQDLAQAGERVSEALTLARGLGDVHGAAHALLSLGQLALAHGEYSRSAALLEEARALCSGLEYPFGQWRALNHLGEAYTFQGDYERAGRLHQEGLALARSMGYYWSIAQALRQVGLLAYHQGDLERAARVLEESIVWGREGRATRGLQWSHADLGHVDLARGDREASAAHYVESLTMGHRVGDQHGVAISLEGLAAVAASEASADADSRIVRAARLLGAATVLREAIGIAISPLERPTVERAEISIMARLGDAAFEAALAEGRAMPLNTAVDDALDLARALRAASRSMPVVAPEDGALSRGAGAALTAREQEVAVLIARGRTNRQIADALAIAERTASTHVTNILGKLGFATRAQVAGWVVGQGRERHP